MLLRARVVGGVAVSIDAGKVGIVAASLMDDLVANQEEIGHHQEIGEVMLITEVRGTDQDGDYTYIRFRCSDEREWVRPGACHRDRRDEDED